MNSLTITGRLGRDAEVRYAASGTAILSMAVANDTGYGDKKSTNWFRCVLFGKRAEGGLAEHLVKGTQVCVSGEVSLDEFEKRDGTKGAALQLIVREIDLIGGKPTGQQPRQQVAQQQESQQQEPAVDPSDDLPF